MVKKQLRNDRSRFGAANMISAVYAQSEAEGILNRHRRIFSAFKNYAILFSTGGTAEPLSPLPQKESLWNTATGTKTTSALPF